jgi:hypothetical protein
MINFFLQNKVIEYQYFSKLFFAALDHTDKNTSSYSDDLNGVVVGYADYYFKDPGFWSRVSHGPFQKV